ncbi:hypothetical protein AC579_4673 [Pseudocercospora musae]|uniref:Uncharacterized protein n=1 Tax=Pseudocercospora musae TaxID=113226 RepID=A0A139I2F3_9PEZI|nr:hypothetical protein AC579_4673 [Pseudocercospora musae]
MAPSLEGIGEGDIKRFAACWLNSSMQCNWDGAAATFDPEGKIKVASFKTVTSKAGKKYGGGDGGNGEGTPKKAAGGKRKKAAGEDGEEGPSKKKGKATPKGKKSEETVNEEDDGLQVKSEASAGEED